MAEQNLCGTEHASSQSDEPEENTEEEEYSEPSDVNREEKPSRR